MTKKRYFEFDLMRAVAMLVIVFYHMNCEWEARGMTSIFVKTRIGHLGYFGWLGVSLFILVSGAAQCISFEKCNDLKVYYKKRWWSIFPSFYTAYFLCYLMGNYGTGVQLFDDNFLLTLVGVDGYASLFGITTHYLVGEWFLGMILVMYILFPFLYYIIKKYPVRVLIGALLYYIVIEQLLCNTGRADKDILANVVVFMIGIYLYQYVKKVSLGTAAAAFVLLLAIIFVPMPKKLIWYMFAVEGVLLYIIFMALGGLFDRMQNRIVAIFKKAVMILSKYSYEIFLVHHVIIAFSLSCYENNKSYTAGSYIVWMVKVSTVIFAAAFMIYPRWKSQFINKAKTDKNS